MVWPNLPYELIGKATIGLLGLIVWLAVVVVAFVVLYTVWYRGLTRLVNLMWWGYDIHGEHPPRWRRDIAVYAHAIKERDLSRVETYREELKKREGRDVD